MTNQTFLVDQNGVEHPEAMNNEPLTPGIRDVGVSDSSRCRLGFRAALLKHYSLTGSCEPRRHITLGTGMLISKEGEQDFFAGLVSELGRVPRPGSFNAIGRKCAVLFNSCSHEVHP
jgi:hypothetical protein